MSGAGWRPYFTHVARSRKGYEDFFAAWEAADAELPALRTAKREYELARATRAGARDKQQDCLR
jgi:hypothetical protein